MISPRWKPETRESGSRGVGGGVDWSDARGIRNEHITIHVSKESTRDVNTIKQTTVYDDGDEYTQVLLTEAIKRDSGFTHILTKRCLYLDHDEHKFKGRNSKILNIGEVDDARFTMFYSLFVSTKDRKFFLPTTDPYDVKQFTVNGFNIIIMFTFLTVTPHIVSMEKVAFSSDKKYPATGMVELQCAAQFRDHILELRSEFLKVIDQEDIPESAKWFAHQSTFFKRASKDTPENQAWWRSLKEQHVARFGWRDE